MKNNLTGNCGFFLAGALIGGAVVALTTPVAGRKMRRVVRDKVEEATDQVTNTAETLREGAEKIYARGERMMRSVGALG